jgi:two-component system OmpR family response regulator
MLTARTEVNDRIRGLDAGADDYLVKPFDFGELLARLRALIRRASGLATSLLRCGPIVLDPRAAKVTLNGAPVRVTGHEFRVLSYLMHQRGRVVPQRELSEHIYAERDDRDSNTVEVFVARLRRKLGTTSIETIRGLGYRMNCGTEGS